MFAKGQRPERVCSVWVAAVPPTVSRLPRFGCVLKALCSPLRSARPHTGGRAAVPHLSQSIRALPRAGQPLATHNWCCPPQRANRSNLTMATSVDQAAAAAAAQGMYIDKQQYEAMEQKLYKAVECKLEQSGVMAALKAQLQADIFAAMVEPSPGEQASTAERCQLAARRGGAGARRRLPRVRRPDARVVCLGSGCRPE